MFEKLIGNEPVKDILLRLLRERRVPNSLLFAGPDGIGKKQFALELAKAFVCQSPQDLDACGECPPCRRVDVFVFPKPDAKGEEYDEVFFSELPDVGMVIPFNRNLRVGAIRKLEREANFRPYEASARVFIVDDADKMNDAASNALLKTLEEPAPTTHIFLISSRPDSLLATIRSRCQMLRFAPVETSEIEKLLLMTHKYSQADARLVAAYSQGNVARAVSVDIEQFRTRRDAMLGALRSAVVTDDLPALLRTAEEINDAKNKENFEDYLDIFQLLIHDVWTLRLGKDDECLVNADLISEMEELASNVEPSRLANWLNEIETLRETLAVNINKKIATDALFVQMAGV